MAKRGRPAKKRKGGRSLEEIQAQIDAAEAAAKKRKEETGLTGAAADPSKQFKTKEKYEEVQRARENSLNPENPEEFQKKLDALPKVDDFKKTKDKTPAVFSTPKAEKSDKVSIANENIDPVILRLIGLNPEETFDIDYDTYKTLLKEKMVAGRMADSKMPTEEVQKVTEEYKRVKGKSGRFKAKGKKIKAGSFIGGRTAVDPKSGGGGKGADIKKYLPPAGNKSGAIVKSPTGKLAQDPLAIVATKITEVNKNVKTVADTVGKKEKEEKKSKKEGRIAAEKASKRERENRAETRSIAPTITNAMKKVLKPAADLFGGILDFFKKLAFGTFVMELIRFLKDPAAYFQEILNWGNNLIDRFNKWTEKWIVKAAEKIDKMLDPFNKDIERLETELNKIVSKLPGVDPLKLPRIPKVDPTPVINATRIPFIQIGNPFGQPMRPLSNNAPEGAPGHIPGYVPPPRGYVPSSEPSTPFTPVQNPVAGSATQALLNTIAFAEGTYGKPNKGYNTHYGGSQTQDLSKHPDKVITAGRYSSAAFGRYQFMPGTWQSVGGGAMTPDRQDAGAVKLTISRLKRAGIKVNSAKELEELLQKEGLSKRIIDALAPEWASFPNLIGPDSQGRYGTNSSYYGQGGKKEKQLVDFFNKDYTRGQVVAPAAGGPSFAPPAPKVEPPGPPGPKGGPSAAPVASPPYNEPANSTANANQKRVASFSAMDGTNPTTLMIKSIYNVVG